MVIHEIENLKQFDVIDNNIQIHACDQIYVMNLV